MFATVHRVSNLEQKFADLSHVAGNGKAFKLTNIDRAPGSGQSADLISHHQGICKLDGNGEFIVSGSVFNQSSTSSDRPYFYVIKNNQGSKAVQGLDYYQIKNEQNPLMPDKIDNNDRRVMTHPGGIQVAENVLAVGMEDYQTGVPTVRSDRSLVRFYDISDESNIQEITQWSFGRWGDKMIASALGLTKRNGQWILAIRAAGRLELYINNQSQIGQGSFQPLGPPILYGDNNQIKEFQGINLLLSDENKVYVFGEPDGGSNHDKMWLHELQFIYDSSDAATNRIIGLHATTPARYVNQVHFYRNGSGPRFKYAACIAANSQGNLEVYSIEMHVINRESRCNGWNI